VSVVRVPQKPSGVFFGQRWHPALAIGGLEVVFARTDHLVGFVKE
jgi:hypothetical protein